MDKKYLLITGATSGIGGQLALQLSRYYNVILHGRDKEKLELVLNKCDPNNAHLIWTCDLSIIEEVEAELSNFINSNQVEIEKFVHCAGYMAMTPLKGLSLENIIRTLNINVISASLISKILILRKTNNAALNSVVYISSSLSNFGAKGMSAYGASKGALDTMMRCLAIELAPKVRFNSVLPGAINTEMTKSIFENEVTFNNMMSRYPLGIGAPEDIANIVEFLLSEKSKWITGQQFIVDGGRTTNLSE